MSEFIPFPFLFSRFTFLRVWGAPADVLQMPFYCPSYTYVNIRVGRDIATMVAGAGRRGIEWILDRQHGPDTADLKGRWIQ
jgi:hypothetical protein